MTPHDWKKVPDWIPTYAGELMGKQSDVHICNRCHQIALSSIGGPVDESIMPGLSDCDSAIVDGVMKQ